MPKSGTRIEIHGTSAIGATIVKPRAENLPLPEGYHVVRYDDGGKLCVHESRFRIISNR